MRQRVLTGIATVAVVSLGLSGCAGLFSDPGTDGLDDVTIAVEPLIGSAAVYLGAQEGFFADEGIALTINSLPPDSKAVVGMVATVVVTPVRNATSKRLKTVTTVNITLHAPKPARPSCVNRYGVRSRTLSTISARLA